MARRSSRNDYGLRLASSTCGDKAVDGLQGEGSSQGVSGESPFFIQPWNWNENGDRIDVGREALLLGL